MQLLVEAFSGIAGDMTLAALLDLGVDPRALEAELRKLDLEEPWELSLTREKRHGIIGNRVQFLLHGRPVDAPLENHMQGETAHSHAEGARHTHAHPHSHGHDGHGDLGGHDHTHVHTEAHHESVHAHDDSHGHGRKYGQIRRLIETSGLSPGAKDRALRIFHVIGVAEAKLHDIALDDVHFHEVGALDAILDICGTAVALDMLGADRIFVQPLPVGTGTVHAAHGHLPLPAPATAEILRDFPLRRVDLDFELVTPTGAGIVAALARPQPPSTWRIGKIGYGVGTKDDPRIANVLRIFAIEDVAVDAPATETETITVFETTIDDATGEWVAALVETLRNAGALDATVTPVQMKKGRTGLHLTVLARPADAQSLMDVCFRESTTIGIRFRNEQRRVLPRRADTVTTPWGEVAVKVATLPDGTERATPEFDSCRAIAEKKGVPLLEVYREASRR